MAFCFCLFLHEDVAGTALYGWACLLPVLVTAASVLKKTVRLRFCAKGAVYSAEAKAKDETYKGPA